MFDTHDGLFHIYRLIALDQAVRAGAFYPRWFPEFAFGYGHPVLNFYGPLSYYWGLPFTFLGADAILTTKLVLAIGLLVSALAMLLYARLYLDRGPAVVAAVVYAYLPYHLTDLYVRGAVAEFLAFAWFPLLLWAFHQLLEDSTHLKLTQSALAAFLLVALIITHSLSALIFAPVLAVYIALVLWQRRRRGEIGRLMLRVVLTLLLAAALSAFYWLPILFESGYVGLGYGTSQGYQDHFLSLSALISLKPVYDYAIEAGIPITFQVGWVQILILAGALVPALLLRKHRMLTLFFLGVALLSLFMLGNASLRIWQMFEAGLAFLQYPWRFLASTALATAMLAGLLIQAVQPSVGRRLLAGGSLLTLVGIWALWALPVRTTNPDLTVEGMWRNDQKLGQVGATWTAEYLPVWVKEQRWALSYPPPDSATGGQPDSASPAEYQGGRVQLTGIGYTRYDLTMDTPQGTSLVLHQFYYPGWQASWQGETIAARPQGALGLATFDLPPGSGPLTLRLALAPAQLWGMVISLATALLLTAGLILQFRHSGPGPSWSRSNRPERAQSVLVVACSLVLALILLASLLLPNGTMRATSLVTANLEDVVELQAFTADSTRYRPGDTVEVTLYWLALRGLDQDYKTFIHLTDAEVTTQPTQHDDDPGGDFTPTTRWLPGEIVPDTHYLTLPEDLAPGRYHLWADMYEFPSVRNLLVLSADAPTDGKRVLLSEIEVLAP
jgi:hypothetical protein